MIANAQITDTFLGREDHGIMTFYIGIRMDGTECNVGGYALDEYDPKMKQRVFSPAGLEAISKILGVVGVRSWESLVGKYIRVYDNGWGNRITKIGNIIDEKWFDMKVFFAQIDREVEDKHEG